MASSLFEYAVIHHPKETKDSQGNDTTASDTLITPPTSILAKSDREVSIIAARGIPETYIDRLNEIEVVIRPFG